jgi:competence protein ComEA
VLALVYLASFLVPARRPAPLPAPGAADFPGLVLEVNRASATELSALPGLGPKSAARIVERRRSAGGFRRVEDLLLVPGIGPDRFGRIRKHLSVGPRP